MYRVFQGLLSIWFFSTCVQDIMIVKAFIKRRQPLCTLEYSSIFHGMTKFPMINFFSFAHRSRWQLVFGSCARSIIISHVVSVAKHTMKLSCDCCDQWNDDSLWQMVSNSHPYMGVVFKKLHRSQSVTKTGE